MSHKKRGREVVLDRTTRHKRALKRLSSDFSYEGAIGPVKKKRAIIAEEAAGTFGTHGRQSSKLLIAWQPIPLPNTDGFFDRTWNFSRLVPISVPVGERLGHPQKCILAHVLQWDEKNES